MSLRKYQSRLMMATAWKHGAPQVCRPLSAPCLFDPRHPWSVVTAAIWQRYPNPYSKHVLSSDVIERYVRCMPAQEGCITVYTVATLRRVDPETKCLHTTRLLVKTNKQPRWMDRVSDTVRHRLERLCEAHPRSLHLLVIGGTVPSPSLLGAKTMPTLSRSLS